MDLKIRRMIAIFLAAFCFFGSSHSAICLDISDIARDDPYASRLHNHYSKKFFEYTNPISFFKARASVLASVIIKVENMGVGADDLCTEEPFLSAVLSFDEATYEVRVALKDSHNVGQFLGNLKSMRVACEMIAILYKGEYYCEGGQHRRHSIDLTSYVPWDWGLYCAFRKA